MGTGPNYLMLDRQRSRDSYGNTLASWSLLLGALAFFTAIYFSMRFYIGFPFEDQWAIVEEFGDHQGVLSLPLLWALHNEHRLPFAKLLMAADLYWFHGQNISLYLECYVLQLAHWALFTWVMLRESSWPKWLVGVGSGWAAFALFWNSQYQSFLNPFGTSIFPTYAFATLAMFALMLAMNYPTRLGMWFSVAIVSALLSESSQANGLLVWPLLLVMAIRFRLRPVLIAALSLVGLAAIVFYLSDYHGPAQHARPWQSIQKPLVIVQYLLVYFGSTWQTASLAMGETFAAVALLAAPVCYLRELFRREPRRFAFALLSVCMFLVGTGLITALGRVNFPLDQASSSRYQTPVLLFWLTFTLYMLDLAYRHRLRSAIFASAAALLLATAALTSFPTSLRGADEMATRLTTGSLPLYADVKDDGEIAKLIVLPDLVFRERPFLQEHAAAFYSDHRYQLLGKPVSSVFQIAPLTRCFGYVDRSRAIPDPKFPGWELSGWAWDHSAMKPVEGVIAATGNGIISGVGAAGFSRPDVKAVFKEVSDPEIGWRAYVQGGATIPSVKLYGIVDEGKSVCLATPAFPLPLPKR